MIFELLKGWRRKYGFEEGGKKWLLEGKICKVW
jgi:hypothetical protein